MAKLSHDERVQLLNEKKIAILQFVMNGEEAQEFLDWCSGRGIEPSQEAAQFFVDMTDENSMLQQDIAEVDDVTEIY